MNEKQTMENASAANSGTCACAGWRKSTMDEQKAREILKDYIKDDGGLYCLGHYMAYDAGSKEITLDSDFRTEELEAIIWWMKNSSNRGLDGQ